MHRTIHCLKFKEGRTSRQALRLVRRSFGSLRRRTKPGSVYRVFSLGRARSKELIVKRVGVRDGDLDEGLGKYHRIILFKTALNTKISQLVHEVSLASVTETIILRSYTTTVLRRCYSRYRGGVTTRLRRRRLCLEPEFDPKCKSFSVYCRRPVMQVLGYTGAVKLALASDFVVAPAGSMATIVKVDARGSEYPVSKYRIYAGGSYRCQQ